MLEPKRDGKSHKLWERSGHSSISKFLKTTLLYVAKGYLKETFLKLKTQICMCIYMCIYRYMYI